jgi:hypothetical protein
LFRVFASESWFSGVFFWLWRADDTQGGTGCSDFTPHGKPAEEVLRRWYGGNLSNDRDGSIAVANAVAYSSGGHGNIFLDQIKLPQQQQRSEYNGFVFGGPDQWSSPAIRYDSPSAALSLLNMQQTTGADSVEIVVQWYVSSVNSTEIYPILDYANPLRTSTDDELIAILTQAKKTGLNAIEIGSPFRSTSIVSVACASSPAPASSDTPPSLNSRRSGTVLSVTSATRRTESRNGATSTTAVVTESVGSRWRYGGNVPSNIREVIVLPSPEKPARRSFDVVGANESETFFEPTSDFAASASVRARISADVEKPGVAGFQLNSRTARR